MVKKGYYENDGLSLAWDLGVIFQAYKIVRSVSFREKKFLMLVLKVLWKNVLVVSLYNYF